MKRTITYLYEYHNGKRGANVGFIKTDVRDGDCRLEVCLQNRKSLSEDGEVCLFVRRERSEGILLGQLKGADQAGPDRWTFAKENIHNSEYRFTDVQGVGIRFPSGRYLASGWTKITPEELKRGSYHIWRREAVPETTERRNEEPADVLRSERESTLGAGTEAIAAEQKDRIRTENETITAEQKDRIRTEHRRLEDLVSQDIKEADEQEKEIRRSLVKRIDLHEIHSLPKRNWYLCNNSFLIHGFFNYHYLVLLQEECEGKKKYYLGVPGIFERPERAMALLFGFPGFVAQEGLQMEGVKEGTFGFWTCLLDM